MMKNKINQVAILGSGVMGSQIAAVFANANIPTLLFGYTANIQDDFAKIDNFKPAALTHPIQKSWISPLSFEQDLAELSSCDLVIEAIIESLDAKQKLLAKILPYLSKNVILASNTSSLSIEEIGRNLGDFESRFCGIHFFNPPRYMSLVELVKSTRTEPELLKLLEGFLTSELGKNILYAQDKVGFIANRIGVFSMASCIHHALRFKLDFDTVDGLTGTKLKRPKSATFRTADLVGLDILKHVFERFKTLNNDPWQGYFNTPEWLQTLLSQQSLGEKTKIGIYKKVSGEIQVYQPNSQSYRPANYQIDKSVEAILSKNCGEWIELLQKNSHPQSQFLYSVIRDTCLYSAYHLHKIAHSVRDIDRALRSGFGWEIGIFELWQANGVAACYQSFAPKKTHLPKPNWLNKQGYFYTSKGAYVPENNTYIDYSKHSCYARQLYRPTLMGEVSSEAKEIIFENDSVQFFHTADDGIAIFSLKTKFHTLNLEAINSLKNAIEIAQKDFKALIIWQDSPPFCAGANLYEIIASAKLGMLEKETLLSKTRKKAWQLLKPNLPNIDQLKPISEIIDLLQQTLMALKYSNIPTIAAVEGLVLGGGCEVLLHCDRRVAHSESYIGLVEAGVGLLPAGGGLKEMARRAAKEREIFPTLAQYFTQIGLAKISTSAKQALEFGYLEKNDMIVAQRLELLYFAKQQAQLMIAQPYRADNPEISFRVGGTSAKANILAQLTNMRTGEFISEYDNFIAQKIADVLCGGEIVAGEVNSQYLLDLEKKHFIDLLKQAKTQDRIEHMLIKHKPLRN